MKISIALLATGAIAFAGHMFLVTKWPLMLSIFFAFIKIYTAFSLFLNQFFS